MDPSIRGYKELFRTEMPIELRAVETSEQLGSIENIDIRVFIKGSLEEIKEVKVELSSEVDLFFHYTHKRNVDNFRDVQHSHKLLIKLKDYPRLLENLINQVKNAPSEYIAVFYMDKSGSGRFDIIQNISYKFLELVTCDFQVSPNEIVRKSIIYRYSIQKNMMTEVEDTIRRLEELMKHRATGLLNTIRKKGIVNK